MADATKKKIFHYTFGNQEFTQRKLKLIQIQQLTELLESLGAISLEPRDIMAVLGKRSAEVCSIVLCEANTSLEDKDIDELRKCLSNSMEMEDVLDVFKDFFICNPLDSTFIELAKSVNRGVGGISATSQALKESLTQ